MSVRSLLVAVCVAFIALGVNAQNVVVSYDTAEGEIPVGIAVDKVGNFWVSLQPICQVRKYSPAWVETARVELPCPAGSTGTSGVAVDATGTPYVGLVSPDDSVRGVWMIDESGPIARVPGTDQMMFPNSIAFDHHNGTMYVTDTLGWSVYRVPDDGVAELWADGPALEGVVPPGYGANGIAVDKGFVIVSVTYLPRVVKIPIHEDGSAGAPMLLYPPGAILGQGLFALDDIVLDVFGNVYSGVVFGVMNTVARMAADGTSLTPVGAFPASTLTLAFGTGIGRRKTLFVGFTEVYQGVGSGIAAFNVGAPGRPVP